MAALLTRNDRRPAHFRITEDPTLFGLVVREQGEFVEYVSYREARRRRDTPAGCPIR